MDNQDIMEVSDKQELKARAKGRHLDKHELTLVKRKLNIRADQPLPLCPARNHKKARKLSEQGDNTHLDEGHRCEKCGCTKTAGWATEHYGYGFCYNHEKGRRKSHAKEFAERHMIALQQRNPALMIRGEQYMNEVAVEAVEASKEFRIAPAAAKVYQMLDSFYSLLSRWEANKEEREKSVIMLEDLKEDLKAREKPDIEMYENISDTLDKIYNKLKFPLTERGGKEMSAEVRFKLISTTLKDVMSAMKIMQDINNVNAVSVERFKIWLHKLHKTMSSDFGEQTYINEDGKTVRIMEGIAMAFAKVGEPTK